MDNKNLIKPKTQVIQPTKRVRLTLYSGDCKAIENLCSTFVASARRSHFATQGPKRLPTKKLAVTTRKSPCGQGTNTFDHFQMRVYKRVIDILVNEDGLKEISNFATVDKNITVEVTVMDLK